MSATDEAYKFITNYQLVLDAFGVWPSFHDAEVHRVILDRELASVEIWIQAWQMKSEMTPEGEKRSIDREGIVHFRFEEVDWLELSSLNHQNSLGEIVFSMIEDRKKEKLVLSVDLMGSYGLCGEFTAQRASVVSVTPPNGKRED